jgi:hypothetical protein
VFESSEDITLKDATPLQRFGFWMRHLLPLPSCLQPCSRESQQMPTTMGSWEKPEVFSNLVRAAVNDPALVATLDIGDVMALDFDIRK